MGKLTKTKSHSNRVYAKKKSGDDAVLVRELCGRVEVPALLRLEVFAKKSSAAAMRWDVS